MKKVLLIALLGMFLFSFVSASDSTYTLDQELDLKVTCLNNGYCSNTSFCNINIADPDEILIVVGENMTNQDSFHNYTVTPNKTGEFMVSGFCKDGIDSEEIDFSFWITPEGNVLSLQDSLVRIFLILFFIGTIVGLRIVTKKIDFRKWNDSIVRKYETSNIVKIVLAGLLYNIMKNTYMIYYLIGLPIVMILANLTYVYDISSLVLFMNSLLLVYTVGILIVGLIFLSHVQEWISDMIELVRSLDWGIDI